MNSHARAEHARSSHGVGPFVELQVRDLKVRDSEAVVRWGGLLLSEHAASLSFEECERPHACASLRRRALPVSDVPHVQHSRAAALIQAPLGQPLRWIT